jgi:hypothetical protein
VFDPVFDAEDLALLAQHGCRVLDAAEAATARVGLHTRSTLRDSAALRPPSQVHAVPDGQHALFFMPHCEQFLYDAVLAANVANGALPRTAILGNSFAEYAERVSLQVTGSANAASLLVRLQAYTTGAARMPPCRS